MEAKDLKKKREGELQKNLATLREKLRDLRFKISSDQLKNVRELRKVKKDIARILTVLNEKKRKESKFKGVKPR